MCGCGRWHKWKKTSRQACEREEEEKRRWHVPDGGSSTICAEELNDEQ